MKQSDGERLIRMITTWDQVQKQIVDKQITKEALLSDTFLQWAITTPLYHIGEQAYQLSSELKKRFPNVPWNRIAGLRHRLVHDYEGINWTIIADVVFDEMDIAMGEIRRIAEEWKDNG